MEPRYTRHQVARGTRADAEMSNKLFLIKRVSELRATYQVRMLTYRAVQEHLKLVIEVPESCKVHSTLRALVMRHPKNISIVRD